MEALRIGAATYLTKSAISPELLDGTLRSVLAAASSAHHRNSLLRCMKSSRAEFCIGNDPQVVQTMQTRVVDSLQLFGVSDANTLTQVSVAVAEAFANAIYHGNLEISSELKESDGAFEALADRRRQEAPWRHRELHVVEIMDRNELRIVIRDEGAGFKVDAVADCSDDENLWKPSGRGLMLMRAFMDEVNFNSAGNEVTLVKRFEPAPARQTAVPRFSKPVPNTANSH